MAFSKRQKAFSINPNRKRQQHPTPLYPDNKYVSFLAECGSKTQLFVIAVDEGEALAVTDDEDGIGNYEWSPNGKQVAFIKADPDTANDKSLKERYGAFSVEENAYRQNHLWLINIDYDSLPLAGSMPCYKTNNDVVTSGCVQLPKAKRLTSGDFSVGNFSWNPTSSNIGFTRLANPLPAFGISANVAMVDVLSRQVITLIFSPSPDNFECWSPDGKQLVYSSFGNDTNAYFYKNNPLYLYNMNTKGSIRILANVDEDINVIDWTVAGLWFSALQKTKSGVFLYAPSTGLIRQIPTSIDIVGSASFAKQGNQVLMLGRNYSDLNEIYTANMEGNAFSAVNKLTMYTQQVQPWNTPVNEVVQWKSKDGATIEGILLKPRNYNPAKKYPLLVVIHGGPTGVDRPDPIPAYVYPIMQWCEKGALVLRVNYRGSAGYGEKFRSLNVNNLGVGDMWDVMSGVDFLAKKEMINTSRMGCMGWSQGGYISAFITTHTNAFKAISVWAGISNWVTYYVSTDITPFTPQYLQATPWADPLVYQKTSPMTTINMAKTPTLIQHGELDRRVPISNAYELFRGLQDNKVPSKLIVYKGFGHGIGKPKERLAAV